MKEERTRNLAGARRPIAWLAGLALACALVLAWWIRSLPVRLEPSADLPATPAARALTAQESEWARSAWTYFENNSDRQTGLASTADGGAATTPWDAGSTLLALIAARDLGVIEKWNFDIRVAKALVSLERMPLHTSRLPHRFYDVRSLEMIDERNQSAPPGAGWSAIDVGRLLVPLNVLMSHHPIHAPAARRVLARWDLGAVVREEQLFGSKAAAEPPRHQGRLGYEHYAARSLAWMGLDVDAARWHRHLRLATVAGVQVCADARDPQRSGEPSPVVSEPYVLATLEFGLPGVARECAWRAYRAQERQDGPVSVPAAFAWHALFRTGRAAQLLAQGRPERAPTADAGAMVLESLAYIARGPALPVRRPGDPPS
jgi:hypothetical protein